MIRFLRNEAACVIGKSLILSDIHIGFDRELEESGFRLPRQTDILIQKIKKLVKENKCKELIILGDLKHSITVRPDIEETKSFVNKLKEFVKSILVQGNHDGALQNYLDIEVKSGKGFKKGKYYFMHGHALPKKQAFDCEKIISSHLHPIVEFHDSLGGRISERVWLRGKQLIVMPAFNELLGGVDIRESGLGHFKKYFDIEELDLYLIDGLYLGRVEDLPKKKVRKWTEKELSKL